MKISPEAWRKVEPLLNKALDLEAASREALLDSLRSSAPDLAPLLAKLLATHDRAQRGGEMETVPRMASAPPASSPHSAGDRVGPYRLLRAIGRGGMGEVWLAEQADGRVLRQVALKLPTAIEAGEIRAERFQRERDILAKLVHPNIARLYDAGASEAGQPYLAMEYVEGKPLDAHLAEKSLALPARIALFRQVLAAVAHAHRHLVVHRDLKPANILIDGSGQVKLLDFGIAKLVADENVPDEPARRDLTRLGGRVMTLRYAAPEQVAEGEITTATDIYSLGVVLHEVLTGASPYRAVREGKRFTDALLLSEDIAPASSLAISPALSRERGGLLPGQLTRALAGDLDAILLKALRRDPRERYAAVEAFDDDLQRHLERRPVKARAGTWRYLAGRFAIRHRLPLAMAAAAVVSMVAGLVLVDHQRRIAVAERERAERHFASVRKLANSFMFDVHGEIENLAGSLKARQLLVGTSLEYLDKLASEGAGDPAVAVEVATAYRKLADLKGDVFGANLGDPEAAFNNLRKARALLDALDASRPGDLKLQRERRELALAYGRQLRSKASHEAVDETVAAVAIAERVVALPGAEPEDSRRLAAAYADLGHARGVILADQQAGLAQMRKAFDILEPMAARDPADRLTREMLAGFYERASIITEGTSTQEDREKSTVLQAKANAVYEALVRDFPDNTTYKRSLVRGRANLAATERLVDRKLQARANLVQAVAVARELAAAAPEDSGLQVLLMRTLGVSCVVESDLENHEAAIDFARQALAVEAKLPPAVRESLVVRANVAATRANLGLSQASLGMAKGSRLGVERRIALMKEGNANMLRARAFRLELVERNIDASSAALVARQIAENVAEVEAEIAKLAGR